MHPHKCPSRFAAEALTKEIGVIRFVINDENADPHTAAPVCRARGRRTVNSVYSPTRLSVKYRPSGRASSRRFRRATPLGLAGAMITEYPLEYRRSDQSEYHPFWAAAAAAMDCDAVISKFV